MKNGIMLAPCRKSPYEIHGAIARKADGEDFALEFASESNSTAFFLLMDEELARQIAFELLMKIGGEACRAGLQVLAKGCDQ